MQVRARNRFREMNVRRGIMGNRGRANLIQGAFRGDGCSLPGRPAGTIVESGKFSHTLDFTGGNHCSSIPGYKYLPVRAALACDAHRPGDATDAEIVAYST